MKKLLITIAVACVFFTPTAFAGAHSTSQITVSGGYAYGSVQGGHNSGDSVQYILCNTSANSSGFAASCYASDASGTYLGCSTTDANLISIAQSVNYTSYISFGVSNGVCTSLLVENGSYYW